jgi:hypothetical protein
MTGNIIVDVWIAAMLVGGYFGLKETVEERRMQTSTERRLQRIYAKLRKRKWQPLPKHPGPAKKATAPKRMLKNSAQQKLDF